MKLHYTLEKLAEAEKLAITLPDTEAVLKALCIRFETDSETLSYLVAATALCTMDATNGDEKEIKRVKELMDGCYYEVLNLYKNALKPATSH